jgi:phage baseplate assembly protein W
MAATYGIDFPFRDSLEGKFLKMTGTPEREIRADLIHLLLTKKGSRYFLPDFGTRLYQYIFDQNDAVTFGLIESEIRDSVKKYIPNLDLTSIVVVSAEDDPDQTVSPQETELF